MEFVFLTEKDRMWAEMLEEVLRNHEIPCNAVPVHGAGLTVRTGMPEQFRIYVPESMKNQAEELLEELFSGKQE